MGELNKVEVVIGGEIITLMSGEREEYMQKLARYIDRKLDEIRSMNSSASINERTRTLFIALNIADDFFKTQEKLTRLESDHAKFVTELGLMQEENFLLADKIHELQDKLNMTRQDAKAGDPAEGKGENVVSIRPRPSGGRR
ncbi:MAG: cell division protein ZapA [Defluviitaleaceae bacterium]|nr:cell division protein ZapA [Defluviitaleaceae bacterium]